MKVLKTITDQMIRKTKTSPEDLLYWFLMVYEHRSEMVMTYPCVEFPYLGKYGFYHDEDIGKELNCVYIKPPKSDIVYMYHLWRWIMKSEENCQEAVKQFKAIYNI